MNVHHDIEFKIGDTVTFCAYTEDKPGFERIVIGMRQGTSGPKYPDGDEDTRLVYLLATPKKVAEVKRHGRELNRHDSCNDTTPNWIVESKYFKL